MAPSNFQAVNITSTNITFSWDSLVDQANGIVQFYVITCTANDTIIIVSLLAKITIKYLLYLTKKLCIIFQVNTTGADTMKMLDNLRPFTSYNCTLHAVTVSDGPLSDPITVTTAEQGM